MKKITLLLLFVAFAFMAKATIYLDETFDYTANSTLKTASGWAGSSIGTWASDFMVTTPVLTYSNLGGTYIHSGTGKAVVCDYQTPYGSSNYYVYKNFSTSSVSTGVVYASFIYTPNNVTNSQTSAPILSLASGSNTGVQVWVGKGTISTSNFRFGTTRGSTTNADIKWATTEYSDISATYLIVLKYDFQTGGTSQISSIFINPIVGSSTEPAADASDATSTSSLKTSIQTVQFKVNGSSKEVFKVGGLRISTTWEEAVAKQSTADPLAKPVVGVATDVTANGFTANWSAVTHNNGYSVLTYFGTDLVNTTPSAVGTTSVAITGLMAGETYTYKVVALGDIDNYSNSELSDESAPVTTLDPWASAAINTDFSDGTWGTLYTATADPGPIAPSSAGTYPSSTANGFTIANGFLYDITKTDLRGESKMYGFRMDRQSYGGIITLPKVHSIEQLEVHAIPGGLPRSFDVKEYIDGAWSLIGNYAFTSSSDYSMFYIPISRAGSTKLRIENAGTGQVTFYQITTRTTNPSLLTTPTPSEATAINATGFTANWTAVPDASGYLVKVYEAGSLKSTVNVSGQSTESQAISELASETAYTYTVIAKGDGDVSFLNSYMSTAVSVTTSTATSLNSLDNSIQAIVSGKTLVFAENVNLNIYNLQGARLMQANNVKSIDTNLNNGMYIVRFTNSEGKQMTQKISIK